MNRMSLCVFLAVSILLSLPLSLAQQSSQTAAGIVVPRLIRFSGAVNDVPGQPRSGVTGITFALYKDQAGGAALWLETQNVSLDAQGRYTVLLGANSAEGMPVELFTANGARWLGVQPEGQAEQRVLLVSVPYALKAADAETLGGMPASSFVLAAPVANSGSGSSGSQTAGTTGTSSAGSSTNGISPATTCTSGSCAVSTTAPGGTANFLPLFMDATTTGTQNSAFGSAALQANTTGMQNAAFGNSALIANTSGNTNSAFGTGALLASTTANLNSAFGFEALVASTTGSNNSAFGEGALFNLKTGSGNLALGAQAGLNLTGAESNNIYLSNSGVAGESNTARIGTDLTAVFITGISGRTSASGVGVFVNTSGQLGTLTSSRRFKHEIADMGAESDLLMKLRPVAFYYKPELDETQTRQYGLVAEEVAQVAPQLVVYDKDGAPQTVRYHFVNAMLLGAVQKQQRRIEEQARALQKQQSTIDLQQKEIQDLAERLDKLEAMLAAQR